ncbi:MAG: hypothetical protein ABL907_04080, partial [Hyphomicrobium sp.]
GSATGLVLLAAFAVPLLPLPEAQAGDKAAPVQEEVQPWALSLSAQLAAEKRCDVQVTYFVRELPSAEGTLYSGRVRCIDGREFDFSQSKAHLKFELRACEPAAC